MVSAPGRRLQVAHARKRWRVSQRRACALLRTARSGLRYQSKREVADAPVLGRMRELAALYPRYGYRFVRIFLARESMPMSAARRFVARCEIRAARPPPRTALARYGDKAPE